MEIYLSHFLPIPVPGTAYRNGQADGLSRLYTRLIEAGRPVGKGGITQAISNRKEGFLIHITVRATSHIIIFEVRQLLYIFVERYRQTASRIVITKEHIGDGLTARLPRIPGLQDRLTVSYFRFEPNR